MQGTRTAYSIFSHFLISTRHLLAYPLALEEKIEKTGEIPCKNRNKGMAPEVGLEPTTRWLTASCSTIELLWIPKRARPY